jgi:transposase-like protein
MTDLIMTDDFPKNQAEFDKRFNNDQACYNYLFNLKWPQGFICLRCGHDKYWQSVRRLFICTQCEHQHSLTAGTIMHGTRKPLVLWFKAMWWFTTRKSGVNAINLQDLLGFGSYNTAWLWLHKLRTCTVRRERGKLTGTIETDEFYMGGNKSGKRGRGAEHKCVVAIAVEQKNPKLGRVRLQVIDNCSADKLIPFVQDNVVPGSCITTDGWPGYSALQGLGFTHRQMLQNKAEKKESVMPGAHLLISLIKRLILGTFQGRFEKKYLQRYLDEYVFRFNRRTSKSVGKKFLRIVQQAIVTPAMTRKQILVGYICPSLAN